MSRGVVPSSHQPAAVPSGLQGARPRATDGGNKDDSACRWEASVAMWRSHCQAGIGVIKPIPYHQTLCGFGVGGTWRVVPVFLYSMEWYTHGEDNLKARGCASPASALGDWEETAAGGLRTAIV